MLLQCLEFNCKYGNIAVLKYHYESFHKDKIDKCMCGNIILSGICANDFSPWGCSLKNESSSSSNSSSNPSSNSNSNSSSNPSSSSNPNSNSSSNPSSSSGSCKYYNFVSFLINNGINIEKIKENINLLKSIDNIDLKIDINKKYKK